ncbi:MAG: flagellar hook assembly protein FlgD [Planctomycetota bacterium]|jgi:flagellar basal-body rod modification protein FlgD
MSVSTLSALSSVTQQDLFLKLLIAQLQNQDPSDPMSNTEMVTQMAQLTAVDGMNKRNASFSDVLKLQRLMGGTELIGHDVEYSSGVFLFGGTVESIVTGDEGIRLIVDGNEISLDDVKRVL